MATYYVSLSGSDGAAGTIGAPFRNWQRGAQAAAAGDTVYIRTGTYDETLEWFGWPGGTLPNNWMNVITFSAYQGEAVTLRGTNPNYVMVMRGSSAGASDAPRYISFDGITFDGTNVSGNYLIGIRAWDNTTNPAQAPAHHIRFQGCRITNGNAGQGILMTWGSVGCRVLNTEIDHINGPTNVPNNTQGIYGAADDLIVDGCHIHNCWGYGISNVSSVPNQDNSDHIIRNNRVHHCGQGGTGLGGINLGEGTGNLIYNNVVYSCGGPGIILGWGGGSVGTKIYNNTVYGNSGIGIYVRPGDVNALIYNNISYSNAGGDMTLSGPGYQQDRNIIADPGFVNIAAENFRVIATSPAVNAGLTLAEVTTDIDGGARPTGGSYDIGAYEYGSVPTGGEDDPQIPIAAGSIVVRDSMSGTINTPYESHVGEIGATITKIYGVAILTGVGRARPTEIVTGGGSGFFTYSGSPSSNEYDVLGSFRVMSDLSGASHYAAIHARVTNATTWISAEYSSAANTISLYVANGGPAALLEATAEVWNVGDHSIRLKVRSDSLSVEVDGIQRIYNADTTLLSVGKAGISFYSNPSNTVPLSETTGIHVDEVVVTNAATGGTITLSGVTAVGSAGAVNKSITKALTGVSATTSLGQLGKNRTVGIVGLTATTFLGIFAGYVQTATGVSSQVQVGQVQAFRSHQLSGVQANTATGALVPSSISLPGGTVALVGVQATTSLGDVSTGKVRALTGVSATISIGSIAATHDLMLVGITATGQQGVVILPGGVVVQLTGVVAVTSVNRLTPPARFFNAYTGVLEVPNLLTIQGVERKVEGWSITEAANNVGTMKFTILSEDGTYAPSLDEEVQFYENGIRIFGGYVNSVFIRGSGSEGGVATKVEVNCTDFNSLASRRYFHGKLPAGTLKSMLLILLPYLGFGTILHVDQPDGPTLSDEVSYRGWKIVDILNQLTERTNGYVWNIDYFKVFAMTTPSSYFAPFNVTTASHVALGDITSEPKRQDYANRVWVYGKSDDLLGWAQDDAQIYAHGIFEFLVNAPEAETAAAVNAIAATVLAVKLPVLRQARYDTFLPGVHAGQSQTINIPGRKVNNSFLVTEVTTAQIAPGLSRKSVTLIEGLVYKAGWRETYRTWGGASAGTTIGSSGGTTSTAASSRPAYYLGGNGTEATQQTVAGTWLPAAGGSQQIGNSSVQVQLNTIPRNGTDALVVVRMRTFSASVSVQARLYDVTIAAACPGVSPAVVSEFINGEWTWETVSFGTTLTPGSHYYELQVRPSVVAADVQASGYVE